MFAKAVLLSALVSSAFATVFITSPTTSSTFNGGQTSTITWEDDGNSPSLAQWGNASVAIYTGNAIQQTPLQVVTSSVNVSSTSTIQFIADPTIGPNAKEYFIRIESLTLVDTNTTFNQMSFSALFTMADMTGNFNASVSAEIDGQSTAPIGTSTVGSTPGSTSGSTTGAAAKSTAASASPASATSKAAAVSTSSSAASSSTTAAGNGAMGSAVPVWGSALFGVIILALMQ